MYGTRKILSGPYVEISGVDLISDDVTVTYK